MESPPKRVTRARAAAKSQVPPTVKIATAASKAKATRATAPTITAAAKRKTRADDTLDVEKETEELAPETMQAQPEKPRITRGRPKKVGPSLEEEATITIAPAKTTRARTKKVEEAPPVTEQPRTRGRPKKVTIAEEHEAQVEESAVQEPAKKVARGRIVAVKPSAAPKKSVKFEETHEDKENVIPATTKGKGKAEPTTGLKAKPVRKTAATRVTRGRAAVTDPTKVPLPLSPKKATQVAMSNQSVSDDELATMEKTPMRPLTRSPMKAPGSVFGTGKKLDFTTSIVANRVVVDAPKGLGSSIMASPARRPPQSSYKDALKASPERVHLGSAAFRSPFKPAFDAPTQSLSPLKATMLQSPARRPAAPMTVTANGSPGRAGSSMFASTPRATPFSISRFATPKTLNRNAFRPGKLNDSSIRPATEVKKSEGLAGKAFVKPFPGRLSAIVPRSADPVSPLKLDAIVEAPAFDPAEIVLEEVDVVVVNTDTSDCMEVDSDSVLEISTEPRSTTPVQSPRNSVGGFGLREKDQDPFQDSDSEDELSAPHFSAHTSTNATMRVPATPAPYSLTDETVGLLASMSSAEQQTLSKTTNRNETIGFTPLARQLSDWMASSRESPERLESTEENDELVSPSGSSFNQETPSDIDEASDSPLLKSSFFDDEMTVRDQMAETTDLEVVDALEFAPAALDEEDLALAFEADEMSLLEPEEVDDMMDMLNDSPVPQPVEQEALSEASQEYGDENEIPIDPTLLEMTVTPRPASVEFMPVSPAPVPTLAMSTPVRVMGERVFHTVSKVPLKPAAMDSPVRIGGIKRSATIARLPSQRDAPPPPFAPTPSRGGGLISTPAKSSNWSTAATPVRTPRRDLDNQIMKGAVVFVDVHTTEGADASAVFVELLGQMGARCVKTWNWSPNGSNEGSPNDMDAQSNSKIGITHVVFKDGGKRTLEKVRESKGIVLCVGVGWVLDCERMNSWLEEGPYAIDTSMVPRGGHRRRKSMEPRMLAKHNGALMAAPLATPRSVSYNHSMSPTKDFLNTPGTGIKMNRRASTIWQRSPTNSNEDGDTGDASENTMILSPVPPTPAPETISAYAEHLLDSEGEQTPYFTRQEQLVQMTAPPKQTGKTYGELDGGAEKGALMQRLLLARRKSLQFAPKVGSPLARGS